MDKKSLNKLIEYIDELSHLPGNEWFNEKLKSMLTDKSSVEPNINQLDEIYEYCVQKIIKEHAEQFYNDFKLSNIKAKLIYDFIRMEKFRRDDNFEDFCLAAYQQLESIINELIKSSKFLEYIIENKDIPAILKFDTVAGKYIRRGNQTVGKMIFLTGDQTKINNYLNGSIQNWFFNHKYRAVLYLYYFNTEIKANTDQFDRIYDIGNFLYQGRNLNHRGAVQSQYQQEIIDDLIPNQHKYYFKFLGFLEDFISAINKYI
jgi:hypothetical protein